MDSTYRPDVKSVSQSTLKMAGKQMSASYTEYQKLGEGTYCSVFRAVNSETKEPVALKLIRMDTEEDGIPASSIREIAVLKSLQHPNIVELRDVICDGPRLSLIFEFMNLDLKRYLDRARIKPDLLKSYAFQMICGVYFIHSRGIVHRNIRPENMLINTAGLLKLCDFGTAVLYHKSLSSANDKVSMLWYRAPELLVDSPMYDFPIDMWSCGCVIAEMARGAVIFAGDSPVDQLMKVCKLIGPPERDDWPEFYSLVDPEIQLPKPPFPGIEQLIPGDPDMIDLVRSLLTMNPAKRITAKEAVRHKYFRDLPVALRDMCLDAIEKAL